MIKNSEVSYQQTQNKLSVAPSVVRHLRLYSEDISTNTSMSSKSIQTKVINPESLEKKSQWDKTGYI